MWTNKEFVAFKIATASKFGPNFPFSLLHSQLMFLLSRNFRQIKNLLLPSKLPQTVN
jgi:hypothetical protein